ncbi:prepilin peptidase [Nocardia sp. NPDC057668]|uniref:prepilin peptidase n=1 Tax=Nocardia sp. NPDC057668 TaxID=3346202 RepID=UPI00366F939D
MEIAGLVVFTLWCAVLSRIDLRERRLPNALTAPGVAGVLGYGFLQGRAGTAALGALLLVCPYLLVHLCAPAALGAGDVKLAAGLGAATALGGAHAWVWAALAAPALTTAASLAPALVQAARPRDSPLSTIADRTVPHGPAMCAASLLALVSAA